MILDIFLGDYGPWAGRSAQFQRELSKSEDIVDGSPVPGGFRPASHTAESHKAE